MIRFLGQPVYNTGNNEMIGYELFIRELVDGELKVPADFGQVAPDAVSQLLADTIDQLPPTLTMIAFNLNQHQFVDPAYLTLLDQLQQTTQIQIEIELTEKKGTGAQSLTIGQLVAQAKKYQEVGISVCLDDVGTGENTATLVSCLTPYVIEYKFALQNVRGRKSLVQIKREIQFWRQLAASQGKLFALEGLEAPHDMSMIETYHPDLVQGYYFGKPEPMPVNSVHA